MEAPLALRQLEADDPRWDLYVLAHPEGRFYHRLGWRRILRRTYGRPDFYLYTERAGRLTGVLPLAMSGAWPFSSALVSIPVAVECGVLADDEASARLLLEGARALAHREKAPYIEYKSPTALFPELPTKGDLYFTFRQQLLGDREKQLNAIPRKTRALLRESERAKLTHSYNRTDLEAFVDLYALSLRNLGTPMFPKELFIASLEEFPEHCDILTVRQCGRIIGCVLNYYFRDTMLPFFAGTLPEARDVGINNYLYWVMLETGYDRGFRVFDFGRSKAGTGAFKFKKHFGMDEVPLRYQYDLITAKEMPNINPTNPKYQKVVQTWQKLPVGLTKLVGPMLSKRLP